MKRRSLVVASAIGGLVFGVALTPLSSYAKAVIAYVTLQPNLSGLPDSGHVNITGTVKASKFQGDGTLVSGVKAFGLTLPMSQTGTNNGGPVLKIERSGNNSTYGAIEGHGQLGVAGYGDYYGVFGEAPSGYGVLGQASGAALPAVLGLHTTTGASSGIGVEGTTNTWSGWTVGVMGNVQSPDGYGVMGHGGANGWGVYSSGNMGATGTKSFQIDDPIDPENYTLRHYCTEGPEPLNAYSGNVTTDARGYATVQLPAYFEKINRDFRYQLTIVDESGSAGFALAKISRPIHESKFQIRTNAPKVTVSWRVEATRYDKWVQRYGAPVRVAKTAEQRGKYLQPELYGEPDSKSMLDRSQAWPPQIGHGAPR